MSYSRRCDSSSSPAPPLGHSVGRRRRGRCTGRISEGHSCTPHSDTDAGTTLCPPHHDTSARQTTRGHQMHWNQCFNLIRHRTLTWNAALWMTEHTLSAYCLRWVYVPQGSEVTAEGRGHDPVLNLAAKEETLFSTSPSGVVKSSCWVHVRVPHKPRTWRKGLTFTNLFELV